MLGHGKKRPCSLVVFRVPEVWFLVCFTQLLSAQWIGSHHASQLCRLTAKEIARGKMTSNKMWLSLWVGSVTTK